MRPLRLLPIALVVFLVGCAGSTSDSDGQVTATTGDWTVNHHWKRRLTTRAQPEPISGTVPTDSRPIEIDGRRLIVRTHPVRFLKREVIGTTVTHTSEPNAHYPGAANDGRISKGDGPFYSLLDADTGRVILPVDFWHIVAVPGEAVYVRTPRQRLANRYSRHEGRERGEEPWLRLDVATGKLRPSDVYFAGTMSPSRPIETHSTEFDPHVDPVVLHRRDSASTPEQPLTRVEIIPPPGSDAPREIFGRVVGRPHERLNQKVGRYALFERLTEAGNRVGRLIADGSTFWLETPGEFKVFMAGWDYNAPQKEGTRLRYYLAMRAPGTGETDDLWLILDDAGHFGAPDGVVGFRPVDGYWTPEREAPFTIYRWMMRLAQPGEDGEEWVMVGPHFEPLPNVPPYRDFTLIRGPIFNSRSVNPAGEREEASFFVGQRTSGAWEASRLLDPPSGTDDRAPLVGASLADLHATLEADYVRLSERWAAYQQDRVDRRREYEAKRRRDQVERQWQDALARGKRNVLSMLAAERGGDSYYVLVTRTSDPAVWEVDRALAATTDAARRSELQRVRAEAQRRQEQANQKWAKWEREQREYHRALAAQSSAWQAASPSGGSSYNPGGSYIARDVKMSYDTQRRYDQATSYSPHAQRMGWQSPYHFD